MSLNVTIQIPDLARGLEAIVAALRKSVEQVAFESQGALIELASSPEGVLRPVRKLLYPSAQLRPPTTNRQRRNPEERTSFWGNRPGMRRLTKSELRPNPSCRRVYPTNRSFGRLIEDLEGKRMNPFGACMSRLPYARTLVE